jgi:hypothetical protein
MKLSFLDFWGDLDLDNNLIINLLRECRENIILTSPEEADIIFCSVFGNSHKSFYNKKKIILFTGENIRPDFHSYDCSLSFDFDSYNGRNIRLPLWYFYVDWFNKKTYNNPEYLIPENYLYGENEFTTKQKIGFCSTVFSAPYIERFEMIQHLNSYKQVDCFGKATGMRIPEGERVKMDIISNYKFNICFENTIYPGYFTEKLLHAKISGCVPIYRGDLTMNEDFNHNCCLNLEGSSYYDIVEKVKALDSDENLFKQMISQPLFNKKIEIREIAEKINKIL